HVFPYSERPGTRAAAMPEQLPKAVRAERARRAQALADALERRYLQSQIGRTLAVLFETEKDGLWQGHSENYCLVRAEGADMHGIMRNVKILGLEGQNLVGLAL
ncbi:MAG: tRNA (N(6)-L-threonylcarbamoyladenosine(37)-C(2))-methylthiotransferase MtaB, partial [Oscillospiraceae bacterium]|nr:tRNA (N(6)-L-threonylcarbamoyladenosine(37)-C(2))-methylthiotransferase MtaB [Oscillospiraceae bacterium]